MSVKKTKIAIVTSRFPKLSETFVLKHITWLLDNGYDVDIYAFMAMPVERESQEEIKKYNLLDKVEYIAFPDSFWGRCWMTLKFLVGVLPFQLTHYIRIFRQQRKQRGILNAFKECLYAQYFLNKNYQIIHAHFATALKPLIFLKTYMPKTQFCVTFHGCDLRAGQAEGEGYYKDLFYNIDRVVSICDYNTEVLESLGCPRSKIFDLPNGVNIQDFPYIKREENAKFHIYTVARLSEPKNHIFALKIMKALREQGFQEFVYHCIGEGDKRIEIEEAVKLYGLEECVELPGAMQNSELRNELKKADIFFLPSKDEAFPVCLLEAQALGLPVVATDIAGIPQSLVHEKTGYLVELDNVEEASARILELAKDKKLRQRMSRDARVYIEENFNIDVLHTRYYKLYNDVNWCVSAHNECVGV